MITLEPACSDDADRLAEIRVVAMRESLERVGRFDVQRARDRLLRDFSPEHTRHILLDGARVGFVVVRPMDAGWLLDHLYVVPAAQSKGVGAAVLSMIFAEADAMGKPIRVGALRESDSNRFYVKHGFEFVEATEWDNYYVRQPG